MSAVCVIYLSVVLMSVKAQPTVDETTLCGCSALDEVTKDIKDEIKDQINEVKELFATKLIKCDAEESSKQALVSALRCEYHLVSSHFSTQPCLHHKLDGCTVWNAHNTVLGSKSLAICVTDIP